MRFGIVPDVQNRGLLLHGVGNQTHTGLHEHACFETLFLMKHARPQGVRKSDDGDTIRVLNSGQQQTCEPNVQIAFNPGFTDHRWQTCEHFNPFCGIIIANPLQLLTINRQLLNGLATRRITLRHLLHLKPRRTNHKGIARGKMRFRHDHAINENGIGSVGQFAKCHAIRSGMQFHMATRNAFIPFRVQIHIISASENTCHPQRAETLDPDDDRYEMPAADRRVAESTDDSRAIRGR